MIREIILFSIKVAIVATSVVAVLYLIDELRISPF